AYLMIRHQRDAVGLVTFDEKICTIMPARSMSSYLSDILRTLDQTQTTEGTNIASALNTIAERIKRRALVLIFSDFFDEDLEAVLQGLKHFRHRKHEVVLFHMLDAQEINFGFTEDTLFIDMESDEKLRTQPVHIKRSYQQLFNEFLSTIKQSCRDQNIDYVPMSTDKPFDYALMNYLQKRRRIGG
ncbi:MAG: VWA domain-containing protein, partial [Deferribacteres bacterium]|nr:VWA domain-containing protein [Deferribacteres bacterium]